MEYDTTRLNHLQVHSSINESHKGIVEEKKSEIYFIYKMSRNREKAFILWITKTVTFRAGITTRSEVQVAQSCLTLCDPMDSPWNSPGLNTGVGSHSLLQGIFPTQGSNPGLLHCRHGLFTVWANYNQKEAQKRGYILFLDLSAGCICVFNL